MQELNQLGIAGATLGILLLVVRYFIKAIEKKDEYIKKLTDDHYKQVNGLTDTFSNTVNDHMAQQKEQVSKQMELMGRMSEVLNQHTDILSLHTQAFIKLGGIRKTKLTTKRI